MNYISIKEAAAKWGVSERMVQTLCSAGRVAGAEKFGGSWAIPETAEKPDDPRRLRAQKAKEAAMLSEQIEAFGNLHGITPESIDEISMPQEHAEAAAPMRVAMPLLNTPFKLGHMMDAVEAIEDPVSRDIALAEAYYFSGQSDKASDAAAPYLTHEDMAVRLSACWIYAYANLALDRIQKARHAMGIVQATVEKVDEHTPLRDKALAICVSTGASVLLHLPLPKILSPLKQYIYLMPAGLRLFVLYIEAHHSYLNKYYGASIGIAETALALEGELYPIPTIYLHLVAAMGYINLKQPEQAKAHLMEAWAIAQPDDLIESFGEHHGLLGGMLEAFLKRESPEGFKRIIAITYKFSAGWRKIHNTDTGHNVADNLTTTEFAAAMLAARDWTNQEIAAHMGISEYTARNYISTAIQKLNVTQRKDLQKYLLH